MTSLVAAAAPNLKPNFDVDALRAQFQILGRDVRGKPLVYLDNAASAQKPEQVLVAMHAFAHTSYANVHRGLHKLADEATSAYESARATVARFLGAETREIVFTRGATDALNLAAWGLSAHLKPGDEILLTEMEHHANFVPWRMAAERTGAVIRYIPIDDIGALNMAALADMLTPRVKVVAVTHVSNVLGTINPVADIARMAHEAGAVCVVDGAQSVVHAPIDVKALGCDLFVFSGHKTYGPTGIGALYGCYDLLDTFPPLLGGGEMIETVEWDYVTYAAPPQRFEAGTPAIIEAVGLDAALSWLMAQDRTAILAHEQFVYRLAAEGLAKIDGVRILGTTPSKDPILSFAVDGVHPHDIAQILDARGIAIRAGHHCAQPLMRRLGLSASARASFAAYNTESEAHALIEGVAAAVKMLR